MKACEIKIDETDRSIIKCLGDDGRIASKDIAGRLGVSEGTVRNRIKHLVESGAVKVAALVNPDALPDKSLAILEIKVAVSKNLNATAEKVAALPGVCSVSIVTGGMDIVAEVLVESKFGLVEFIGSHLASIPGIVSTESHLVMRQYAKWLPSGSCIDGE